MADELRLQKDFLNGDTLQSIYFGGGTPSILTVAEITALFSQISAHFQHSASAEITLEANPDDIIPEKLKAWRHLGINRLSIGLQSFNDEELRWMNRAHPAKLNEISVKMAQDAGFDNITVDLIYGSKFQNLSQWEKSLEKTIALGVTHVSAYNLTIEGKTKLNHLLQKGEELPVDDQLSSAQFQMMTEIFASAGILPYEISNFAKPGCEAVHNSNYWLQLPYLGIGPSAHSYKGNRRQWNVKSNALYIQQISKGEIFFETELLSPNDLYNEFVLTRLRTKWGVHEKDLLQNFGQSSLTHFKKCIAKYLPHVEVTEGHYVLKPSGRLLADKIASDLFLL